MLHSIFGWLFVFLNSHNTISVVDPDPKWVSFKSGSLFGFKLFKSDPWFVQCMNLDILIAILFNLSQWILANNWCWCLWWHAQGGVHTEHAIAVAFQKLTKCKSKPSLCSIIPSLHYPSHQSEGKMNSQLVPVHVGRLFQEMVNSSHRLWNCPFVGQIILGRGCRNRRLENLGIAKIGLTPPPLPQSWHSGGFDDKSA